MYALRQNDVEIYDVFPHRFGEEPYIVEISIKEEPTFAKIYQSQFSL